MRSRTLANERIRSFYGKLKRPYLFNGYLTRLGCKTNNWRQLPSQQKQREFKINQIAFFKKHFWFHFKGSLIKGWIPVKHFRKNYCRLQLPVKRCSKKINSELACILMLCQYVKPSVDTDSVCAQYRIQQPRNVRDLFMIVAGQVGRFQNISYKSMRRVRNQIRHQRPVVMRVQLIKMPLSIIIAGFNRRLFQYVSPLDGKLHLITQKRLLKVWRKCQYQAFSC